MKKKSRLGKTDSIFAKTTAKVEPKTPGPPVAVSSSIENKMTVIMPPDQVAFLDRLCLDIRAKTGAKVRRTEVIRALVAALKDSKVDLTTCGSEETLTAAIVGNMRDGPSF